MYLLRAPENFPKQKRTMLGYEVTDGIVKVGPQYYWHTLIRHGWDDVTPGNWPKSFCKPAHMENVLLIHRSGAGDMLFMTPLIKAFKEKYPGVKVHVATNPMGLLMIMGNPHMDGTFIDAEQYLPHYLEDFDDVVCFNGIMTKSHECNFTNVFDMFANWAGIELPDERKKPEIYLSAKEKENAEKFLQEKVGWKEGDKLVTIQLSASSPVRSVEEWKKLEVAKKIRDDGYKVFVFSKTQLNECVYVSCERCGTCEIIPVPQKFTVQKHKCGKCSNVIDVHNRRGVEGIACSDSTTSIRMIAGIIEKASFHIGPDSVGNHLAAAFDVPCLGLFSSFDADLRMRYYPKARWIQKEFPCAPCFSHHMQCRKQGVTRQNALCMAQFTVDEIYAEFKKMEAGEPFEKPAPFVPCASPRACPVCSYERRNYINRKGTICYYECLRCGAVYTDIEVEVANNADTYYEGFKTDEYINGQRGSGRMLHKSYFREGELNRVLDIGCGVAHTLDQMRELGWDAWGLEYSTEAIKECHKRYPETAAQILSADVMTLTEKESFSLVWMNNVLEHIHQPRPLLEKVWKMLEPGGVLSVQIPNLAVWKQMLYCGKWEGVNNSYAGEHSVLYNAHTLTWLMEQCGFGEGVVEKLPGPDCLWMSFRKQNLDEYRDCFDIRLAPYMKKALGITPFDEKVIREAHENLAKEMSHAG